MSKNKMKAILKGEVKNISGNKYRQEFIIGRTDAGVEILRVIYGTSIEHIKKRAEEEFYYKIVASCEVINNKKSPDNRMPRLLGKGTIYPHNNKGSWAARIAELQEDGTRVRKNFYAKTKEEVAIAISIENGLAEC